MRIVVRSKGIHLWLPIPLSLANAAVRLTPEFVFAKVRHALPPPYHAIVTKPFLRELAGECLCALKQYRGLELIHVEAQDGTFVSVRL